MKFKVLIVEDNRALVDVLKLRLDNWGFEVEVASDFDSALESVESFQPNCVLTDVFLAGKSGLDLLEKLKESAAAIPVVVMTGQGTVDMAVEAMKAGAADFVSKPIDFHELRATLEAIGEHEQQRHRAGEVTSEIGRSRGPGGMIGKSAALRDVFQLVEQLAPTEASILVSGESGTGKELVCRALHELSSRADEEFLAVNAAAIPAELMESEIFGHEKGAFTGASERRKGCFELAHGGTLFLDEISEMPLPLQPKLLRILEDGLVRRLGASQEIEVDVRVVAATNRDPDEAIRDGLLRADLYHRLNVFGIRLPPLRERGEDLELLLQHFIASFNAKHETSVEGVRKEAADKLKCHRWPGNVRELSNVVERAVVLASTGWIEMSHLPPYLRSEVATAESEGELRLPIGISVAEAERQLILRTLEAVDNNKSEAARRLDIDVKTIRNKLKRYAKASAK